MCVEKSEGKILLFGICVKNKKKIMRKKKLTENCLKTPSSIFTDETQNEFFF